MKKPLLFLLLFNLVVAALAQHTDEYVSLVKKANDQYKAKEYKASMKTYESAFDIRVDGAIDLYNAACVASLLKKKKQAFGFLSKALDNGYSGFDHIQKDEDLYPLHPDPEWKKVLERTKRNEEKGAIERKTVKEIKQLLLTNTPTGIMKFGTDEFRKNTTVEQIILLSERLKTYMINNGQSDSDMVEVNSSRSTNIAPNGVTTITFKSVQEIMPLFFGANTGKLLLENVGAHLIIDLINLNNIWMLSGLQFNENQFAPDYKIIDYVDEYFPNNRNCDSRMMSITSKKTNQVMVENASLIRSEVIKTIQALKYVGRGEEKTFIAKYGCSISFLRMAAIPADLVDKGDLMTILNKNQKIKYLELLFTLDSNKIIISTGDQYGIYIDDGGVIAMLMQMVKDNMTLD